MDISKVKISGFMKTTLLDFPGKVAATVFLPGCNMRCPFCHNADLVFGLSEPLDVYDVLSVIEKRRGILDGVCITGGEPTLHGDGLIALASRIKELGLLVKLDTNGTRPEMIRKLTELSLVDYIAMDIKHRITPDGYKKACGADIDTDKILESVSILNGGSVDNEFRTTLVRELHTAEDVEAIAEALSGGRRYFLQHFVDSGNLISPDGLHEVSAEDTQNMVSLAKRYIHTEARGI